jgi:hypothetical protein
MFLLFKNVHNYKITKNKLCAIQTVNFSYFFRLIGQIYVSNQNVTKSF